MTADTNLHNIVSLCIITTAAMKSQNTFLVSTAGFLQTVLALNNGIGLKPHMGWSSWVFPSAPMFSVYG